MSEDVWHYMDDTTLTVNRCQFINHEDPSSGNTGVIIFDGGTNANLVTIANCLFSNIGIKKIAFRIVASIR